MYFGSFSLKKNSDKVKHRNDFFYSIKCSQYIGKVDDKSKQQLVPSLGAAFPLWNQETHHFRPFGGQFIENKFSDQLWL